MRDLHAAWFFVAVFSTGAVGLWGIALAALRRSPGRSFLLAARIASAAMLLQVAMGLALYADEVLRDQVPAFHVFYGMVILFTFAFAYIFRVHLERRPAVIWGVVLLFVMGLGVRAWMIAG
jgi:CHASE2 domain-containing sensor protein